jgi:hypothetical protein
MARARPPRTSNTDPTLALPVTARPKPEPMRANPTPTKCPESSSSPSSTAAPPTCSGSATKPNPRSRNRPPSRPPRSAPWLPPPGQQVLGPAHCPASRGPQPLALQACAPTRPRYGFHSRGPARSRSLARPLSSRAYPAASTSTQGERHHEHHDDHGHLVQDPELRFTGNGAPVTASPSPTTAAGKTAPPPNGRKPPPTSTWWPGPNSPRTSPPRSSGEAGSPSPAASSNATGRPPKATNAPRLRSTALDVSTGLRYATVEITKASRAGSNDGAES